MSNVRSDRMEHQRHEFFEDIIAHSRVVLIDLGFPEDVADQAGVSIVELICTNWAGQVFTIPMDYKYKMSIRDMEIYHFHKGDFNLTARKFGMTERGARKVITRVMKRLVDKNQAKLF